jgi:hypothetical protein
LLWDVSNLLLMERRDKRQSYWIVRYNDSGPVGAMIFVINLTVLSTNAF